MYEGLFYEQIDGAAMGSVASPVVANFFMEHFETDALAEHHKPPRIWLRYVDDALSVCRNSNSTEFLEFLNSRNRAIKFIYEIEFDNKPSIS